MNAFLSNASLIIHPQNTAWSSPDANSMVSCLSETGLTGKRIDNAEHSFLVGDHFLDLIAFMGCAPSIRFAEEDKQPFTHIRLLSTPDTVTAFTSQHSHAPHCPFCKKPEKHWSQKLGSSALECSACGQVAFPWDFNWRRSAGFGRFFIEITEIYPQEAIPQDSLLDALEVCSGTAWQYFYHYP